MAIVRLVVVLLVLGAVLLLGVQNLTPALPLVFLGGSAQALPLGVWLVGAIALGALTTLVLTALLGSLGSGPGNRSAAYQYRPQSFYEPAESAASARVTADRNPPGPRGSGTEHRRNMPPPYTAPGPRSGSPDSAPGDPTWQAWTNLQSPGQWNDWESLSQAPKPEATPAASSPGSGIVEGVTTWFSSSKQRAKQQQRVNESLRALDDDWGDMEHRPYRAPGASPVQDSLDEINQGWGQVSYPNRDVEASQAPRRVYRDGSLYSYSYRGEDEPSPGGGGQIDNIYAPPDDAVYGGDYAGDYSSAYAPDETAYDSTGGTGYGEADSPDFDDDTPLGEPEMAEDGVVDADYRVIVPPYTAAAEAAATSDTWAANRDDEASDDWDAADDALTP